MSSKHLIPILNETSKTNVAFLESNENALKDMYQVNTFKKGAICIRTNKEALVLYESFC